ncbi:MAG: DMT family transporter [Bacteroidetes bacterium]|nr:DMT family transporter [Bacteroidota bacterium]
MIKLLRGNILLPYFTLAFGILCIGFSPIFVKLANVPGDVSALYRMLIAGSVIIPWWIIKGIKKYDRKDIMIVFAGGVVFAIDLIMWNTGLLLTSAATSTFLANSAPIWVGLGTLVFFKEKLESKYWIGLLIALLGMTILVGMDFIRHLSFNLGNILSIGAGLFYASYLLTTQHARSKMDTLSFMSISLISSIFIMLTYTLIIGTPLTGYSNEAWLSLAGLGLISHMGGWLSINYAIGHMKVANVSVSLLLQSVIAAILSLIILGEPLVIEQIAGGLLILTGVFIVNRVMAKRKQ